MVIRVVHTLREDQWRTFIEAQSASNLFHTPEMFQVFERAKSYLPTLWAATSNNDHVLALLIPVKVTLIRFFSPLTSRSIVYGGIIYEPTSDGLTALRHLLVTYNREAGRDTLFTEVRNLADASSIRPILEECGFAYEAHQNFLIDLNLPVEAVWNNIHKSARKNLRRALNKDQLVIEEVHDRNQLPAWYALLQQTYDTVRVPLADFSLFESAFNVLHPKGMVQFLLGRVEDTHIAASVALLYKGMIYGWYRGFDRKYLSYMANDLMVWRLLQWGAVNGYRTFDFGGAGKPDEDYGPRDFKAKFGGALVNYGRNIFVHAPLRLKLGEMGFQLLRRFL